ncbi:MAG: hypothetical protein CVV42_19165 [Candidatus Riflebacteria bacterium HGW-Riflebacteria-2]|jgi:hypothetical protein|nr:MAG: hypothetical protein CVV42_19165 [Candidatus Riflebacteria bacterium HGW-Riflebacteria-2]
MSQIAVLRLQHYFAHHPEAFLPGAAKRPNVLQLNSGGSVVMEFHPSTGNLAQISCAGQVLPISQYGEQYSIRMPANSMRLHAGYGGEAWDQCSYLLDNAFRLIGISARNELGSVDSTSILYDDRGFPLLLKTGSRKVIFYRVREPKPRQTLIQGWNVTEKWKALVEDPDFEDTDEARLVEVQRSLDRWLVSIFLRWFVYTGHGLLESEEIIERAQDGGTIEHRVTEFMPFLSSGCTETLLFSPGDGVAKVVLGTDKN